jgi:hypothetical protein
MTTKYATTPKLGGTDDAPPLVHSLPAGTPTRPGAVALCGERTRGIKPKPNMPLCTLCEAMRKDGGKL